METDLIANMSTNATLTHTIAASDNPSDGIADALTQFGEDLDGQKVLVIPPTFYARLRKSNSWIPNTEIGANALIRGTIGMIHGCQVVPSNRLAASGEDAATAYIVKPGALAIFMKRDTLVEFDRDILAETNYIKASKLFAPYVYDQSKLVKVALS